MLLLTIKYLMRRGTTTRIVLMSATLDTNEYSEYFHMVFGGDRGNQSTRGNAGDDATSTGYDVNQDYPEYQSSVGLRSCIQRITQENNTKGYYRKKYV